MAHTSQRIVFVARAGIDVDANAREVAGQGLCSDADAIGQGGDVIEFGGVLEWWFRMASDAPTLGGWRMLTLSWATAVARDLLPAHAGGALRDEYGLDSPWDSGRQLRGLNMADVNGSLDGAHGEKFPSSGRAGMT